LTPVGARLLDQYGDDRDDAYSVDASRLRELEAAAKEWGSCGSKTIYCAARRYAGARRALRTRPPTSSGWKDYPADAPRKKFGGDQRTAAKSQSISA